MFHGPLTLSSRAQQTRTTRLTMEFTASSQPRRTCAWSSFFAPPSACGSFSSCPLVHIHLQDFLHLLWPGLHLLQCHEVPPTTFLKLLSSSSSVCRPQSSSISFFCIFRELTFRLDISVFFGWSPGFSALVASPLLFELDAGAALLLLLLELVAGASSSIQTVSSCGSCLDWPPKGSTSVVASSSQLLGPYTPSHISCVASAFAVPFSSAPNLLRHFSVCAC